MSKIIVNNLSPDTGISTITVAGNVEATKFVGIVEGSTGTFSSNVTIDGNLGVAGTITYEDVARVDATGLSTFREGFGVGPLAGIALTAYKDGSIRSTGIITATTFSGDVTRDVTGDVTGDVTAVGGNANEGSFLKGTSVGIGTTTTAGRNAGVSTSIGTLNFNTTLSALEYYNGSKWIKITDNYFEVSGGTKSTFTSYTLFKFTSNGTLTVTGSGTIDILVVAGGGQGGLPNDESNYGGGGGAGGLVWYTGYTVEAGDYSIVVGAGGVQNSSGSGNHQGNDGSDSTAFGLTAKGGGGGGGQDGANDGDKGRPGGSGGGGGYHDSGGATTQSSQSNTLATGTLVHNLGFAGGAGNNSPNGGGGGGGAGAVGMNGSGSGAPVHGGAGKDMSSLLGTAVGDNGWFSGGGGGSQQAGSYDIPYGNGGQGLYGGGGRGDTYNSNDAEAGDANTGGGGGAGTRELGGRGGGSGVVIVRVATSLL